MHYFKNKDGLFKAATEFLDAVPEGLVDIEKPCDLIIAYLTLWDSPATGRKMRAVARAGLGSTHGSEKLQEFFVERIAHLLGVNPSRAEKLPLIGALLVGVAVSKYLVEAPWTANLTIDELADQLEPAVTALLESA